MKTPPTAWLGGLYSDGSPLVKNGHIDYTISPLYAQHDYLIFYPDIPPILNNWLSTSKPISIAKITLSHMWEETRQQFFSGALYQLVKERGGLLRSPSYCAADVTVPGLVDEILELIQRMIINPAKTGLAPWRGIHIEALPSMPPVDTWAAGLLHLQTRLRERIPIDWKLWWNGGVPENLPTVGEFEWTGVMLENWPFQGSTTRDDPAGAFSTIKRWYSQKLYEQPIIFTNLHGDTIDSQRMSYALACAALFNCVAICAPGDTLGHVPKPITPNVDLGLPYEEPWESYEAYRRSFEHGHVLADPTFPIYQPSPPARGRGWIFQN